MSYALKMEKELTNIINFYKNQTLPSILPSWLINLGVKANDTIIEASNIGSNNHLNKTDVIIKLNNSTPIKISMKLINADYFGNWYSHNRIVNEFGDEAFANITQATTDFANKWKHITKKPYVEVSISFGKRVGKTGQLFTDLFKEEEIINIVQGVGIGDNVANCLYVSNTCPKDIGELINNLMPINLPTIKLLIGDFKIIYRPVNPLTEKSNRGKNSFTIFIPNTKLAVPTIITSIDQLNNIGKYATVKEPNGLNHNNILNILKNEYNIIIPRK